MRIKRTLFKFLTLASTVLFVGTASLWARSYWYADELRWATPDEPEKPFPKALIYWRISSQYGGLDFQYGLVNYRTPWPWPKYGGLDVTYHPAGGYPSPLLGSVRYGFAGGISTSGGDFTADLTVPHWFILLLCTPAPEVVLMRRLGRRREAKSGFDVLTRGGSNNAP